MKWLILACLAISTPASADIRKDHKLHAGAGAITYTGARLVGATPVEALVACMGVGVAKEIVDLAGSGKPELSDVAATSLPCILAAFVEEKVVKKKAIPVPDDVRRDLINFGKEKGRCKVRTLSSTNN